jgi:DNA integrity scanning protein DisA with diadenylate cyclase activity
MRHHSAAEFVDRSEGAIAIVISQDGTVTVFDRLLGDLRETEIDV